MSAPHKVVPFRFPLQGDPLQQHTSRAPALEESEVFNILHLKSLKMWYCALLMISRYFLLILVCVFNLGQTSFAEEFEVSFKDKTVFAALSEEIAFLGERIIPLTEVIDIRARELCGEGATVKTVETKELFPKGSEMEFVDGEVFDLSDYELIESKFPFIPYYRLYESQTKVVAEAAAIVAKNVTYELAAATSVTIITWMLRNPDTIIPMTYETWNLLQYLKNSYFIGVATLSVYSLKPIYEYLKSSQLSFPLRKAREISEFEMLQAFELFCNTVIEDVNNLAPHKVFTKLVCEKN